MSLLMIVLPLRVLASRAVLVLGFDTRQLRELPSPLDKEMDDYGRLQGTYRVESTNYEIELVSKLSTIDPASENEANHLKSQIPSHIGFISEGQDVVDIVVNRVTKEEWSVKHGYNFARRFKIVNKKSICETGRNLQWCLLEFCYPEAGRIEKGQFLLQDTLKLDGQDSLVWTVKTTSKNVAVTWTCRTCRLRRSFRKSLK